MGNFAICVNSVKNCESFISQVLRYFTICTPYLTEVSILAAFLDRPPLLPR
jgi:hypothetical protein